MAESWDWVRMLVRATWRDMVARSAVVELGYKGTSRALGFAN